MLVRVLVELGKEPPGEVPLDRNEWDEFGNTCFFGSVGSQQVDRMIRSVQYKEENKRSLHEDVGKALGQGRME